MKRVLFRGLTWLRGAPNRKHQLDFIAGLLSIPVLLSVIILNYSNIQNSKASGKKEPTPTPVEKIIIVSKDNDKAEPTPKTDTPTPSVTQTSCKKSVGPINISYPSEGATVKDNPVFVIIKYDDEAYCSVVWSYRINGGTWSDYNSNSVGLYNLPEGVVKFELRVQSTASPDQEFLERNFKHDGSSASSSGSLQ